MEHQLVIKKRVFVNLPFRQVTFDINQTVFLDGPKQNKTFPVKSENSLEFGEFSCQSRTWWSDRMRAKITITVRSGIVLIIFPPALHSPLKTPTADQQLIC